MTKICLVIFHLCNLVSQAVYCFLNRSHPKTTRLDLGTIFHHVTQCLRKFHWSQNSFFVSTDFLDSNSFWNTQLKLNTMFLFIRLKPSTVPPIQALLNAFQQHQLPSSLSSSSKPPISLPYTPSGVTSSVRKSVAPHYCQSYSNSNYITPDDVIITSGASAGLTLLCSFTFDRMNPIRNVDANRTDILIP